MPTKKNPALGQAGVDRATGEAQHAVVSLSAVAGPAHLMAALEADALAFHDIGVSAAVNELMTELHHCLMDARRRASEMRPHHRLLCLRGAFGLVQRLRELAAGISTGLREHLLTTPAGKHVPWRVFYIVVTPAAQTPRSAVVDGARVLELSAGRARRR